MGFKHGLQIIHWAIANIESVKWWHKNASKTGFCINGYLNAYHIIVRMKSGKTLVIETKGDLLENSESERKCKLDREWANLAGSECYYSVQG